MTNTTAHTSPTVANDTHEAAPNIAFITTTVPRDSLSTPLDIRMTIAVTFSLTGRIVIAIVTAIESADGEPPGRVVLHVDMPPGAPPKTAKIDDYGAGGEIPTSIRIVCHRACPHCLLADVSMIHQRDSSQAEGEAILPPYGYRSALHFSGSSSMVDTLNGTLSEVVATRKEAIRAHDTFNDLQASSEAADTPSADNASPGDNAGLTDGE